MKIVVTVVAMTGIMLKRQTLTITGQKRNLILLNHSNATSTGQMGEGKLWAAMQNMQEIIVGPVEENGKDQKNWETT